MPAFTPDSELDLQFDADLISPAVKSALHPDLHIRPLASSDYHRGHLAVLAVLSVVTDPGEAAWVAQFHTQRACPHTYYTVVIIHKATDKIVAVGAVIIERKFIRGLGSVGHEEDIAVDRNQQGKKLGLHLINALTYISEANGAYKATGNCNANNIPFYKKCGWEVQENTMAKYTPASRAHSTKL